MESPVRPEEVAHLRVIKRIKPAVGPPNSGLLVISNRFVGLVLGYLL